MEFDARRDPDGRPDAAALAQSGRMKLRPLASHHFGLARTGEAFALQAARADGIIKAIIHP